MKRVSGIIWLDYVDARRRLAHAWRSEGLEAIDIAIRFEVDVERVQQILAQPIDPPLPGCSRDTVATLQRRVADLERELHRTAPPGADRRAPAESEFRALRLHPDPEVCGCQHWTDTIAAGAHNPRCEHAPKAGG